MENVSICVCHPSEQHRQELVSAFKEHDADVEVLPVADLRQAVEIVKKDKPDVLVIGVDTPDDPAIRAIVALEGGEAKPAVIVVSQSPSQELLVACMRAGSDEFLEFPIQPAELAKSLERLYRKKGLTREAQGKMTAVYGAKGGLGTTSVACNLAASIAQQLGGETPSCILDLNLQLGGVALYMDVREFSYTLADACRDASRLDAALVRSYMTMHGSGTAVLPAPLNVGDLEEIDSQNLTAVLQQCQKVYEHVVLDLPHHFDAHTIATLDQADTTLLICDMTLPAIQNTIRAVQMFRELDYKKAKLKLVINRYYDSDQVSIQEVSEHVQIPVFWLIPYDSPLAISAANSGHTFTDVDAGSQAAQSMLALAQQIAGLDSTKPAKKKRRGLFALRR